MTTDRVVVEITETASQQIAWLSMPVAAANTREADDREAESAARYIIGAETFIDSTSALRIEEEVDIAFPRLSLEIRKTAKPGFTSLGIARVLEVRDRQIVFCFELVVALNLHFLPVAQSQLCAQPIRKWHFYSRPIMSC